VNLTRLGKPSTLNCATYSYKNTTEFYEAVVYMNETQILGISLYPRDGISYLLGSSSGQTKNATIQILYPLVGFQVNQTPTGVIQALSIIENTCTPPKPFTDLDSDALFTNLTS
jgi:hypothetical protein